MNSPNPADRERIERLVAELGGDGRSSLDELVPRVYAELRLIARRHLAGEQPGHTLDSTALVGEAYLKLAGHGEIEWQNRPHFCAIASRAMRAILVDHARARKAAKRGGGVIHESLDDMFGVAAIVPDERLLAIDAALSRLEKIDEEACRTVEYRYFGGMTLEEIAVALDRSVATVKRRWSFAKRWLERELVEDGTG